MIFLLHVEWPEMPPYKLLLTCDVWCIVWRPWRPFLGHQPWSWTTLRRDDVFYHVYKRFFYFCHVFIFIWTFFYIYVGKQSGESGESAKNRSWVTAGDWFVLIHLLCTRWCDAVVAGLSAGLHPRVRRTDRDADTALYTTGVGRTVLPAWRRHHSQRHQGYIHTLRGRSHVRKMQFLAFFIKNCAKPCTKRAKHFTGFYLPNVVLQIVKMSYGTYTHSHTGAGRTVLPAWTRRHSQRRQGYIHTLTHRCWKDCATCMNRAS